MFLDTKLIKALSNSIHTKFIIYFHSKLYSTFRSFKEQKLPNEIFLYIRQSLSSKTQLSNLQVKESRDLMIMYSDAKFVTFFGVGLEEITKQIRVTC